MKKRILIITYLVLLAPGCHVACAKKSSSEQKKHISVTILYDNYGFAEGLKTDWGFSCLLKGVEKTVLFDTGSKGELLLENFEKLKVNPKDVEQIISEFRKLGVKKAGPAHCTGDRAIQMFKQAYGPDFVQMGVGRILKTEILSK